jgi:hypothetical protein
MKLNGYDIVNEALSAQARRRLRTAGHLATGAGLAAGAYYLGKKFKSAQAAKAARAAGQRIRDAMAKKLADPMMRGQGDLGFSMPF